MIRMQTILTIGVIGMCLLVSAGCSVSGVKAGPQVNSVIEYVNGYAEFSLQENDLRLCTPNQIIQIYCQALRYGDDSTFRLIQKNSDRKLRTQYVIDDVMVMLVQSTASDQQILMVSFDIANNDGELFPIRQSQLSLEFTFVRDKHSWVVHKIKPI